MKNNTLLWLNKHYPTPAREAVENGLTGIQCIEHSLRKWRGFRPGELEAHDLAVNLASEIEEANVPHTKVLSVDAHDCSLCLKYAIKKSRGGLAQNHLKDGCCFCPIFVATGKDCSSEFDAWCRRHHPDPEPMIALLERTLEHFKTREVGIP